MSLIAYMKDYMSRMFSEVDGMKALLLDEDTTGMVSMVLGESDNLERDVFLTRKLSAFAEHGLAEGGSKQEELHHLKGVVFVRPSESSISHLEALLRSPPFAEIYIFFSSTVRPEILSRLAGADQYEVVRGLHEFYGDVFAINHDLFSLEVPNTRHLMLNPASDHTGLVRIVDGILSACLLPKIVPTIRYQGSSIICRNLAETLSKRIDSLSASAIFEGKSAEGESLLLILDRREDPVTPLLTQWTYQAMVHELLGVNKNLVDLTESVKKRMEEETKEAKKLPRVDQRVFVLAPEQDSFFKKTMFLNYGDLGFSVKELVEQYQKSSDSARKIESIADMQRFVENYAGYLSESSMVQKHVAIMTEISAIVDRRSLMKVSALEQALACEQDHNTAVEQVKNLLDDKSIGFEDKIRVVMLYALRYEGIKNELPIFRAKLRDLAFSDAMADKIRLVDELLKFSGEKCRTGDVFSNKDWIAKTQSFLTRGLSDVKNIYTQHQPLISKIIDQAVKRTLKDADFPTIGFPAKKGPKELVIFIMGGATYEEAAYVAQFNASSPVRVFLGGTSLMNSSMFLSELSGDHFAVSI